MNDQNQIFLNPGLSKAEKNDLEEMIGQFRQEQNAHDEPADLETIGKQIEAINKRLAYLTNMFLTLDKRMQPLFETIRLTFQKTDILNQRIDAIIEALRNGEQL